MFSAAQQKVYEQILDSIMDVKVGKEAWRLAKEEARKHALGAFSSAGVAGARPPKPAPKAAPKPPAEDDGIDEEEDEVVDTVAQLRAATGPEPEKPKPKKAPKAAPKAAGATKTIAKKAPKAKADSGMYKPPTKKELKEAKKPRPVSAYVVYCNYKRAELDKEGVTFPTEKEKLIEIGRRWREEVPDADKAKDPPGKWQRRADRASEAKLKEWYAKQGIVA